MNCKNCGKKVPENLEICPNCGNDIRPEEVMYMTMPVWKLILLMFCSFGLYIIIWAYKYWNEKKKQHGFQGIHPIWRAIIAPITFFSLFPSINDYIKKPNISHANDNDFRIINVNGFSPIVFAIIFFIANIIERYIYIPILSTIVLSIIQYKVNKTNDKYNIPAENNAWSWKTLLFVIISCTICFLSFIPNNIASNNKIILEPLKFKNGNIIEINEANSKSAGFVIGFIHSSLYAEEYCKDTGYTPNLYIKDFKKKFYLSDKQAHDFYDYVSLDNNLPRGTMYSQMTEQIFPIIDKNSKQIYDSEYQRFKGENSNLTKRDYCKMFDDSRTSIIKYKVELLKKNQPNWFVE